MKLTKAQQVKCQVEVLNSRVRNELSGESRVAGVI